VLDDVVRGDRGRGARRSHVKEHESGARAVEVLASEHAVVEASGCVRVDQLQHFEVDELGGVQDGFALRLAKVGGH